MSTFSTTPTRLRRPARSGGMRAWHIGAVLLSGIVLLNIGVLAWFTLQFAQRLSPGREGPAAGGLPSPLIQMADALAGGESLDEGAEQLAAPSGIVNILILGIDQRLDQQGEPTRSDVMMVLRVDFDQQEAHLLSFPRDIWIPIPEIDKYNLAEGRINQAYYYGEKFNLPGGGPQLAKKAIELNFGVPIDHYVLLTFDGFEKIVDALGGIDIDVPERIYDPIYPTDDYGTMVLEIEPGLQHMDGEQALRYARTRHQDSDTKRVLRQQLVLMAIRDQALRTSVLANWRQIYEAVRDSFETDIPLPTMVSYALAGQRIKTENIHRYAVGQTMLIPWVTSGGAHVWIPKRAAVGDLINQFMAHGE